MDLETQTVIVETGCVEVCIESFQSIGDSAVLQALCKLVSKLCFDSPAMPHGVNQAEIVELGLLDMLQEYMKSSSPSANALTSCAECICSLSYRNGENVEYAISKRVPSTLAAALAKASSPASIEQIARCISIFIGTARM